MSLKSCECACTMFLTGIVRHMVMVTIFSIQSNTIAGPHRMWSFKRDNGLLILHLYNKPARTCRHVPEIAYCDKGVTESKIDDTILLYVW